MSTAQQNYTVDQQQRIDDKPVLDSVIEATQQRQGIVDNAAAIMGCQPAKLLDLLRNVWHTSKGQPDLTPQEMFVGISLVARYGLDPIAREVYVTRSKKGLMTIVGIDGWIKILCRTPHYDGHEVEIHEDANGKVDWVETRIHSKDRTYPATYKAFMSEYIKMGGFVAQQMPSHMLRLFSLRHAARQFVPLAGVTTEEEARWMTVDKRSLATAQSVEDFTGEPEEPEKTTTPPVQPEAAEARSDTIQSKVDDADHVCTGEPPTDDLYFRECITMYRETDFGDVSEIIKLDAAMAKDDNLSPNQKWVLLDGGDVPSESQQARERIGGEG